MARYYSGVRNMGELMLVKDTSQAKQLSKLMRQGKVRRIYKGVYSDNLKEAVETIVLHHWMEIVPFVVPGGVLSYRTAFDIKPTPVKEGSIVYVTSTYTKTIELPGLIIKVVKGNNKDYLEQLLPELCRSNVPRMLLENLKNVRGKYRTIKTVGLEGVETYLAKELHMRGESCLNTYRDSAKAIAKDLDMSKEYVKLNKITSALLSTHPDDVLTTIYAKAVLKKEPYDRRRIKLFEELTLYLKKCIFKSRKYEYEKTTFNNISFFESYFSNFIEGTEFFIEEAEEIVFQGKEIQNRHADSHDILAHYILGNDYSEMNITPKDPKDLLNILQYRHANLMRERPDKRPGDFKKIRNRAGNTYFVDPDEVIGTLSQGFKYYDVLEEGMQKALFMHVLVSEVHPFDDGNGRIARIMMNAELVRTGLFKIIIPTVHRDNYLNGLKIASRDNEFRLYCKVMDQAQAYTESINWLFYNEAKDKIEHDAANLTSDEGLPRFNVVLRELVLSEFAA